MSNEAMLKQLHLSIKQLHKSEKIMNKVVDENISKLPDDKKKQALNLINKSRQGKHIDLSEMLAFTSGIRDIDKKNIEKSVKRANAKKKEVT